MALSWIDSCLFRPQSILNCSNAHDYVFTAKGHQEWRILRTRFMIPCLNLRTAALERVHAVLRDSLYVYPGFWTSAARSHLRRLNESQGVFGDFLSKVHTEVRKCLMVFVEELFRNLCVDPANLQNHQSNLEFILVWEIFFYFLLFYLITIET